MRVLSFYDTVPIGANLHRITVHPQIDFHPDHILFSDAGIRPLLVRDLLVGEDDESILWPTERDQLVGGGSGRLCPVIQLPPSIVGQLAELPGSLAVLLSVTAVRARSRRWVLPREQVVDWHAREPRNADRHARADDATADDMAERDVLEAERLRDGPPSPASRAKEE